MSQQLIGLGTVANDGTGDDLRAAGDKINDNFTELYAAIPTFGAGVVTFLTTPTSANLSAAVTDETGTGALVLANTPTLVSPLLGTPTSGVLTNCTGYPAASLSGLGAGVATFLATPSSANLIAAVTGETGTGALVFADTPTLVTPVLGVASATNLFINGADALTEGTPSHLHITDTSTVHFHASFIRYGNDSAPGFVVFGKSRGGTGVHVNLANFDDIGAIDFKGSINGAFRHAARIEGRVYDHNVGVGALPNGTVCPGFIDFTCTDTAGSTTHCLAITPVVGNLEPSILTPGLAVGGVAFFPERSLHVTHKAPLTGNPVDTVTYAMRLTYVSFDPCEPGVGVGIEFETQPDFADPVVGSTVESVCFDNTLASEDFGIVIKNRIAGALSAHFLVGSIGGLDAIWLGTTPAGAPTSSNYALFNDNSVSYLNGSGGVKVRVANTDYMALGSGEILMNPPGGVILSAANYLGLGSDTFFYRDAAETSARRNGTASQTHNHYDTFTSATDYHRLAIKTARATLSGVTGASVTATNIIPDGAVVVGVTTKVTTGLGVTGGTTGYTVGTVADPDRWGTISAVAAGTSTDNTNWTAGAIEAFLAASNVVITALTGPFDGTGVIYVSVQYLIGQCD